MKIICSMCGRDIDAIGQDNMSYTKEPLCEDCWNRESDFPTVTYVSDDDWELLNKMLEGETSDA